jgi:hypothetical protein
MDPLGYPCILPNTKAPDKIEYGRLYSEKSFRSTSRKKNGNDRRRKAATNSNRRRKERTNNNYKITNP